MWYAMASVGNHVKVRETLSKMDVSTDSHFSQSTASSKIFSLHIEPDGSEISKINLARSFHCLITLMGGIRIGKGGEWFSGSYLLVF